MSRCGPLAKIVRYSNLKLLYLILKSNYFGMRSAEVLSYNTGAIINTISLLQMLH